MSDRRASGRRATGRSIGPTVLAMLLACMLSLTACRDSEPPPQPEPDDTPVDLSGERRRQAHVASEGGPQRTGPDNEPAFQGPADGDVEAAGYGEGYSPSGETGDEHEEADEDEDDGKLLEP